ncbi:hypothetical protein [Polluticaenibacter yanchengensis]|uniref:DUF4231 domain-containing protein n=1 Tax=Polluticaenibacter yanchengensis TaxID=3014562 RepID=A0ABT4UJH1_9BACT|nr:hypothetical protein [Chitinophagaceae bacterium LY-5]
MANNLTFMGAQITESEKRFLRYWEEQRTGGKWQFIGIYSFGLTILVFILSIAIGLFMSFSLKSYSQIIITALIAITSGIVLSFCLWSYQEQKFKKIIKRFL